MNKKTIIPIALILLVGLSAFVYAYQTETVNINRGWNLIIGFALTPEAISQSINQNDIKVIYAFIPTIQDYAMSHPNQEIEKLRLMDDDELLTNAWWIYTEKSGSIQFETENIIPLNQRKLYSGWNFFTITPDITGKSFNEIKGSCNIEKAYGWDSDVQNWVLFPLDEDFYIGSMGLGIIVKASNNCNLGSVGGNGVSPPPLPPTQGCIDSDGKNFYLKGKLTKNGESHFDYCDQGIVYEYWCDGQIDSLDYYTCPNGCQDGACIQDSTSNCRDSDGGLDYTERGTITGIESSRTMNEKPIREGTAYDGLEVTSGTTARLKLDEVIHNVIVGNTYTFNYGQVHIDDIDFFGVGDIKNNAEISIASVTDFCKTSVDLVEWVCDSQDPSGYDDERYACPNGCSNGKCL